MPDIISHLIPFISLFILAASWGYSVCTYGGAEASSWRWSVLGIALASLVAWLSPQGSREGRPRKLDFALLALVLLLGVLQLLPVSTGVIQQLSPQRARQLAAASEVVGVIPQATLSSVPAATRDELLRLASYILVYLLVCDLRRSLRERHWILASPIILIGFLEAALGLVQYYNGADTAVGTYVNRNHFAGLLEMSLPLAVMFGFFVIQRDNDRFQTPAIPTIIACLFFGMGAVMLISVINSQSRMGFISVLASLLVIGVVGVASHFATAGSRWRRWLPMTAVALLVTLAFVFLPTDQLISRFASMATTQEPSEETRRQIWSESVPLIKAYAVTGCGLGTYASCFLPYKAVAPEFTVDFAHNDYLQVMAEFGVPAFALLIALAALAYGTALRRTGADNPGRYLAIACVGSLTAILLHSFVDFNLYVPANGLLAVWIGAMARES